jgi:hypothetical protein
MIVRILGEGQYSIADDAHAALDALDADVVHAVDSGDEQAFAAALAALIAEVRDAGKPVADDDFAPSDLVVPFSDATLEETKGLLAESGEGPATDDR